MVRELVLVVVLMVVVAVVLAFRVNTTFVERNSDASEWNGGW